MVVKNVPASAVEIRNTSLVPVSGRSPGGGHGNPLQHSCLENPTDSSLAGYSPWGQKELDTTEACMHASIQLMALIFTVE